MTESRRITMAVKLTDDEARSIDQARGAVSRSEWLRGVALAAAQPGRERLSGKSEAPPRRKPAVSKRDSCSHPAVRVHKGLCAACGTGGLS